MASPRERAASIATASCSFTLFCPMNSASRCGRSFNSKDESSSTAEAETSRSGGEFRLGLFLAVATGRILSLLLRHHDSIFEKEALLALIRQCDHGLNHVVLVVEQVVI